MFNEALFEGEYKEGRIVGRLKIISKVPDCLKFSQVEVFFCQKRSQDFFAVLCSSDLERY